MHVIVPLAGPDFVRPDGSVKAEQRVEGAPLLRRALSGRSWAAAVPSSGYSFILLDRPETRRFASGPLAAWYPDAHAVFLSRLARGAALSAVAGVSGLVEPGAPVIVDLADILYDCALDPAAALAEQPDAGGIALTFESRDPAYSYLETDAAGGFVRAAEKRVISSNASAGTYIFANAATLLSAVAHALENAASQTHNDLFYTCPLFNGVRAQGRHVRLHAVTNIRDVKTGVSHAR